MKISADKKRALVEILKWYDDPQKKQFITLGGYAGTGKTTLIALLSYKLHKDEKDIRIGFASYTGKAARVLRETLRTRNVLQEKDTVGTIHSMIYSPIVNDREEIVGWKPKEKLDRDLIIIDEASMVDSIIWEHLLSYDIPILAVGDHGQLPPIRGQFNLMKRPELLLTQIHRQAKKNPIIDVSIMARERGVIEAGKYGEGVIKYSMNLAENREVLDAKLKSFNQESLILCGFNHTRVKLNNHIRASLGFNTSEPRRGDRVINLRNNYEKNIFNGMLGTVLSIKVEDEDWYRAEIEMDGEGESYHGLIAREQFNSKTALNYSEERKKYRNGDLYDFGYALTVHKAQGSQARRVILIEERFSKMSNEDWRRWLYTGVTRAISELYIFGRD